MLTCCWRITGCAQCSEAIWGRSRPFQKFVRTGSLVWQAPRSWQLLSIRGISSWVNNEGVPMWRIISLIQHSDLLTLMMASVLSGSINFEIMSEMVANPCPGFGGPCSVVAERNRSAEDLPRCVAITHSGVPFLRTIHSCLHEVLMRKRARAKEWLDMTTNRYKGSAPKDLLLTPLSGVRGLQMCKHVGHLASDTHSCHKGHLHGTLAPRQNRSRCHLLRGGDEKRPDKGSNHLRTVLSTSYRLRS